MYHYKSRRVDQAFLRKRIRELAETRIRYGYKRIYVLLRREGWKINHKRVHRLYREEGLSMRHKAPRRRVSARLREDRCAATAPNECWSMDFMHDELFDGRRLRLLTIVDNFSRVSPGIGVKPRYQATEVVETLTAATRQYGIPKYIRVDNGPEFVAKELDLWAYGHGVILDFSRPGKPTDNAFIESFNSRLRQECLNQSWFLSLEDARGKIEAWRMEYNHVRPHSAIGDIAPAEFLGTTVPACRDSSSQNQNFLT
jgi:putative transposase